MNLRIFNAIVFLITQCYCQDGWFEAATYVVTQAALDEAPYRYAKFLDEGLRKLENEPFPMVSNGDPCAVRYRIGPARGEKVKLNLKRDTIKVSFGRSVGPLS